MINDHHLGGVLHHVGLSQGFEKQFLISEYQDDRIFTEPKAKAFLGTGIYEFAQSGKLKLGFVEGQAEKQVTFDDVL